MKRLTIRNFGPIIDVVIEQKRINLILGPQNSGKSTVLKVACFCDWMERKMALSQSPDKFCQPSFFVENLLKFHKLEGFMHPDTYIKYENDAINFEYDAASNCCNYKWGNETKRWKYRKTKIAYIPSERNLVAAIPNWYQVSMNNNNILDFMKEWEFARKSFPNKEQIVNLPFSYRYNPGDMADRIVMEDGYELSLTNASSGLQSLTPLYVMLCYLTGPFYNEKQSNVADSILRNNLERVVANECSDKTPEEIVSIVDNMITPYRSDIFIEEPEAHIFPSTQKAFSYSLAGMLNGQEKHFCFIATHSPYMMTSFNNLIFAGELAAKSKEMAEKISERFAKRQLLRWNDVSAYSMQDGHAVSIMDEDMMMMSAEALDSASQEIADDFNFLLSL